MFGRKNLEAAVARVPENLAKAVNEAARRHNALKNKDTDGKDKS
jgi:hypothetical protein